MLRRICFRRGASLVARPPASPARSLSEASHWRPRSVLPTSLRHPAAVSRTLTTSGPRRSTTAEPSQQSAPTPAAGPEKPTYLTKGESQVWDRLVAEFSPTELVVRDISGGCGSMYGIEISSEKFRGLTMLKQQRLVNAALSDLMKEWHGVQLKTKAP
ncbi:hypothetical protein VTJ04DRAFT_4018 [Mycothermus thermophilus]|uniref:uncharacterized protein n=1 Tax=Humicola insolens TaxID=85995 RepID=UPI0037421AAC